MAGEGGEALPIEIKALPAVSACVRLWGGLWLGAIRLSLPAPSTDAPRLQERPLRDSPPPPRYREAPRPATSLIAEAAPSRNFLFRLMEFPLPVVGHFFRVNRGQ